MNTDTTEPAKSLGQVALEAFRTACNDKSDWEKSLYQPQWEVAAQAVLHQFLSSGPVSAEDAECAIEQAMGGVRFRDVFGTTASARMATMNHVARELSAILAARHANPVQAEGGWEHASGIVAIQRGWRISQCDLVEKNHYVAQHVSNVFEALKTYRRRIPTVQPAVAVQDIQKALNGIEALVECLDLSQVVEYDDTGGETVGDILKWMAAALSNPTAAQGQGVEETAKSIAENFTTTEGRNHKLKLHDKEALQRIAAHYIEELLTASHPATAAQGQGGTPREIEGMMFNFNDGFVCPDCGGSHFGAASETEDGHFHITSRNCGDQFGKGCKWRGEYYMASDLYSMAKRAKRLKTSLTAFQARVEDLDLCEDALLECRRVLMKENRDQPFVDMAISKLIADLEAMQAREAKLAEELRKIKKQIIGLDI